MSRLYISEMTQNRGIELEAFNPNQIEYQDKYNSGGPKITEMLYDSENGKTLREQRF